MAATGDTLAGTAVSTTRSGATVSWTNPSNALDDNTTLATCAGTLIDSHWLHITNFNFSSIPDGSTINGIKVKFRRRVNTGSNDYFTEEIRLVNSGTLLGTAKNYYSSPTYWTTTATVETHGGVSDTWGWTPVLATLKSSTFGVQLAVEDGGSGGETCGVEVLWMDVTYTLGSVTNTTRGFFALVGGF